MDAAGAWCCGRGVHVKCPRCQHENTERAKFCEECASPLTRKCANCGAQLSATAKFCPECAHPVHVETSPPARFATPSAYTPLHLAEKILTSRSALEGERKQVTVLFADLKGSMELLADRDPEEARRLLDPVLELMMEAVHHFDGTVNQVMGDGIMALFGAPIALEDHGVRACYAALRMQDQAKRHALEVHRTGGLPAQIRVGLNSGEVVVRSVGSDLHMDYTAVGLTTNVAARMEQMAVPGSILIASETFRLAEGYVNVNALGPRPVKGLDATVDVYELIGASTVRSRLQASVAKGLTAFVGRDSELDVLGRQLQLARNGKGQIVAAVGEGGVGKSRLYWEFTHSHRTQGCLVVERNTVSYGKATAYLPIIELLKMYFQIEPHDAPRKILEKVIGRILSLDLALDPFVPAFLSLLDVSNQNRAWEKLDLPQRRQRTLEGLRVLLLRESRRQPVIVLFEDLHWIDSETQTFLDDLVEGLPATQILLLVNYRPDYQHGWARKTYYREIRLDPLPPESLVSLLQSLLGEDPALEPLKRLLIARTEGNPFFLEESVRTLVETKFLEGERGDYRQMKAVESLRIPATAQAILAARIDRLSPENKWVLQAAAIGKDVPLALLQAIADEPEDRLRRCLAELQAAEFLYEAKLFPDLEYTFRHELTQDVASSGLLQERRRLLDAKIVGAIERLYPERLAERAERLAHHALRGEVWDKAFTYSRQAGAKALARSANREAVVWFDRALGVVPRLATGREAEEAAIDLRFELRLALMPLGEFDRTFNVLREAEALATALQDQRRIGQISGYMINLLWEMGDQERAIEAGQRALAISIKLDDAALRNLAHRYLGRSYHAIGQFRRAVEVLQSSVSTAGDDADASTVLTRMFVILCLAEVGAFAEAIEHGEKSLRIARTLDDAFSVTATCSGLGRVYLRKGEFEKAVPLLEQALAVSDEAAIPLLYPFCAAPLGAAYARLGRMSEALPLLEQAVTRAAAMRRMVDQSLWTYWLGEALLLAARADEARDFAQKALELSITYNERASQGWVLRLFGDIHAGPGAYAPEKAEDFYRRALVIAEELEMRPLQARCCLSLGVLYERLGRKRDALAAVTNAHELCRAMDLAFWLGEADAALQRLE
jgi:class 3 adenylate cyclase/tetratricopeptide (TPR) repeat protein